LEGNPNSSVNNPRQTGSFAFCDGSLTERMRVSQTSEPQVTMASMEGKEMSRWSLTLLCCLTTILSVYGQKPVRNSGVQGAPKTSAKKEVDPEVIQKRTIALTLLSSLAIEARSYRDEPLRARVQARVADALWDQEQETARSLFMRAWEAAEAVDLQASGETGGRSMPGRTSTRPTPPGRSRTNLRSEILLLASARDHKLGEIFLAKLTEARKDGDVGGESGTTSASPSNQEVRERLRLAKEFLEKGNVQRALQFADPALFQTTMETIQFLVALRDKDVRLADQRFARLLAIAAEDTTSDANTVSLLTSYAFTPSTYLQVSDSGIPSIISNNHPAAPPLEPALRSRFFRVAANILLRPFEQVDRSSAGRAGTYLIARRLFPVFQQHAPDLAATISAHLAALGPEAAQATHRAGDRVLNRGFDPTTGSGGAGTNDIEADLNDLLDRARSGEERDRAYVFAAMQLARAGDARAYDFVDKIEDTETRKAVRGIVDYGYLRGLLDKKKAEEVVALVARSELKPALRSSYLRQAAEILAKTDRVRALEVLEKALEEARRAEAGSPERAYLLVSLLADFIKFDRARAGDLAREMIKAANNVSDFTGENSNINWTVEGKFSARLGTALAAPGDLPDAFAALAVDDFYQAVDISRTFKGDAPRALATLAIARAVLEEKRN
jgi:hypothetical protein